MKINKIKNIYKQMLKSGEREFFLDHGRIKIFDFLKINDSGITEPINVIVYRKDDYSDLSGVFSSWEIKNGKFKKLSLDFLYFYSLYEEDALFKKREKSLEDFFMNIYISLEISNFLYFCFPLFEKFCKIYFNWNREIGSQKLLFLKYFFSIIKKDETKEAQNEAVIDLLSNKTLKDLGFGKKKNPFLVKFFSYENFTDNHFELCDTFKKISPEIFKELGAAEKEFDIFKYFNKGDYYKGISVFPNSFVSAYERENYPFRTSDCINIITVNRDNKIAEKSFSLVKTLYENEISIIKAFKYLEDVQINQFLTKYEAITLYDDYLNMSFKLFTSFEKYPKRLKTMHDKVVDIFNKSNIQFDDATDVKIKERYLKLSFLEGELDSEHLIVLPKESKDITSEGKALAHCVGFCVSKVADNDTTILFIRNKKNIKKPLYTAEIKNGKIIQLKGLANSEVPVNIKKSLKYKLDNIIKMRKGD